MGLFSFLGGILGLGAKEPTSEIKVSKASAVAGLPIIYGRRRVTPVKVYKTVSRHNAPHGNLSQYDHTFLPSSSNEEEVQKAYDWLHRIDVWAQGEISAIEKFWIDGDEATARRFSARPYFRALSKYGTETQTAMNALTQASDVWSAAHRGFGVAYSWVRFYNSAKKPQFTAEPEVKALIKGLRVYDPREAGQSFSDPDSWTYSNNRALVVLNYLMSPYGFNSSEDEIDLESFRIAADKCDEELTIPAVLVNTTSGPAERVWDRRYGEFVDVEFGEVYPGYRVDQTGTSQARWVADAVIDPKQDVIRNIKTLLEGFGWSLPWSNGRHRLVLEDLVPGPVMTFTDADIVGGWTMEHGAREGRWNRITLEFANANKDFEQDSVSWPLLDSATYAAFKAEDQGADLHTNETLHTITDYYQAQAYAEFLVRKSRVGTRIEGISLGRKALLLEPGDVIQLSYMERGLNDMLFIVEKVSVTAYLDVEADLTLYDPTVYGGEPLVQEPLNTIGDAPDLWSDPYAPEDLQLVSFHEENADGTMISGINVSWDAPASTGSIERFELRWRKTGEATFTGQRYLGRDSTFARIAGLVDDTSYDVQLTYWTQRGQESIEAEQTITLPASPSRFGEIEDGATRNVFRGAYNDTVTYERGDIVTYEGSSYIFISSSSATGVEPTHIAYWSLFAQQGPQGVPGPAGADGQVKYTWIRYADSATGSGISNDPTGKAYIGFAYNKNYANESNDPSLYQWSLVQGPQGSTGVPGAPGSDGQTTYTWIRYSANPDGDGMTDNPVASTKYIGIAVNKTTPNETWLKADYTWSRWKGEDGASGLTINASPASITVACSADGTPKNQPFNYTSQIALFAGNVDVTAGASYSMYKENCLGSVSSSGLVTFTNMSADSAFADVTATYQGIPLTTRISLAKARDGRSSSTAMASVYPSASTSYMAQTNPSPVELALFGGGTVSLSANFVFKSSNITTTEYMKFQAKQPGGSWTDVGGVAIQPVQETNVPHLISHTASYSVPATEGTYQFRLLQKYGGAKATASGTPGNFSATFVPA